MAKRDYYEILGLAKGAGKDEIKKSYRKIAMKYHPDKNPGDTAAEAKFKEAAEAYSILSDEQKKAHYDQYGHVPEGGMGGNPFDGFSGGGIGVDLSDALRIFMEGFGGGGGLGDIFGGGSHSRGRARGADLKVKLPLTLEEIATGVTKKIKVKRYEQCTECSGSGARKGTGKSTCSACHGRGEVQQVSRSMFGQFVNIQPCSNCDGTGEVIEHPCRTCRGDGRERRESVVSAKIPAGVHSGNYMTLRGEGNQARRGGQAGDLIILIDEREHELFIRDDDNIYLEIVLNMAQAVMGTELEIPTLTGKVNLKIPAGSQSGKLLRLRGKGIPRLNSRIVGDQMVKIQVKTPQKPSKQEREIYQRLADYYGGQRTGDSIFRKIKSLL
ncbi:MAG: molecular chaperone DnaJ [Candidatus Marinimicrobia bacterium]|nr:molecular chaperone DnaJ [Candidatus Neomarinimicrobiota bacterium]